MKLYDYFRSSAAYRVRIALNLKGIARPSATFVHLRMGASARRITSRSIRRAWCRRSSSTTARVLTQSLAIIEYLDETHPAPPLLPTDAAERAPACARSRWRSPATSIRSTTCACCTT